MKKNTKNISNLLAAAIFTFALSSCSEDTMDKINKNDNNPLTVDAKFTITDLEVATAFSVVGGDLSLYSSIYIEHEAGVHGQMFNAEMRKGEPSSTTTYNNVWGSIYTNIKNAKVVIKKCSPGGSEEGSDITLGIGKVFLAYNAAVLADLFGDAPYFEAGELDNAGLPVYRQPKVDKQEDIYKDVLKNLDEAIVLFDGTDAGPFGAVGGKDILFGGDGESWKKVAYALKARYTMRLLAKSSTVTQDLNNVISYVDKSFESSDEEFKLNIYDGDSQVNPLAAFSYSRGGLAAGQSLFDKFRERNDPRTLKVLLNASDKPIADLSSVYLAPNGDVIEQQYTYDYLATDYAWDAPTMMMSYHELLFLKAEAYARLNNTAEAEKALEASIYAGFENLSNSLASGGVKANFSDSIVADYFEKGVKPLFDANPLKEIMIQKYLSFVGASGESVEAYNDYRRLQALGENFIKLDNPKNTTSFPLRFTYGNSDVLANPNVTSLVSDRNYVYTEKVWWAGGTR